MFKIKAPKAPGTYVEYFAPVAEHLQWMDASVRWDITVVPKAAKTPVAKKPASNKSGTGILPMPDFPEGPSEFYDGVEGWLRSFSNFFGHLLGGLTKM